MAGDHVTIEPLDVFNYATWSMRMKALLIMRDLYGTIDGTTKDEAKDQKAKAVIMLNVKDHHLAILADCKTAKDAWEKLATLYKAKTNAARLKLRQELNTLKMEPAENLTKYISRTKGIYTDLKAAGDEKMTENDVAWSLLAGLPKEYETITTIIMADDADLQLDKVMAKLSLVEKKIDQETEVKALYARGGGKYGSGGGGKSTAECWHCHETGHIKAHCPKLKKKCDFCGMNGHLESECRKKNTVQAGCARTEYVLEL
jgi:hypothetical protein